MHSLKMLWQSTPQPPRGPRKTCRGAPGALASKRDVLSLLNLSPRHGKEEGGADRLELKELPVQRHDEVPPKVPTNGHWYTETAALTSGGLSTTAATRPLRLPLSNGYKFLSPGRLFPSSKC